MEEQPIQWSQEEVYRHLQDRTWRLNNLYWIRDEKGNCVKFKERWAQRVLRECLFFWNLILKARQLGFTTFIAIYFLDSVIFDRDKTAVIIAHTLEKAREIFDDKIRFAFDNLPDFIKAQLDVNTDNVRELKFQAINGVIRVTTSARGGTAQLVHISELGQMAVHYPEKAKEVLEGTLNAVHEGAIVFVESTAKGMEGVFADICNAAIAKWRGSQTLTRMDWKLHFFPWFEHPDYRLDDPAVTVPKELRDYFDRIEQEYVSTHDGKRGCSIDIGQRRWYVKKFEQMRNDEEAMHSEFPSTPEEALAASVEGAYYVKELANARKQHRIGRVPFDPRLPVDTWWDLGLSKESGYMAVICTQRFMNEIRVVNYYENFNEGMGHYIAWLSKLRDEQGYVFKSHHAPQDIEVREMTTGRTRMETSLKLGIAFTMTNTAELGIPDGIQAVRNIFGRLWIDEENCAELLRHLSLYRREWDEKLGVFKPSPRKDEHSHAADALRCIGVGFMDIPKFEQRDVAGKRLVEPVEERVPRKWDRHHPFPAVQD